MLTKDLLRVSRAGGGYSPQFADEGDQALAARVIGVFQGHVGEPRGALEDALETVERESSDFKLARGFAALVEREATFETRAPVEPERARRAAFAAASSGPVVTETEREEALTEVAADLGATPRDVAESLFADRDEREVLLGLDVRWDPADLVDQYNLSLAQTALFDATEIRVRSSDPKALVSAVKRLRLMYEIRKTAEGREVVVTGPDALFHATRRYGTRFARLLRTVANTREWRLEADVDDRGTGRTMVLTVDDPVRVPDAEPIADVTFDSAVEANFAARFEAIGLDWNLLREPEPLEAGARVMIPDFAFDYRFDDVRIYFEIMGFWTPEYVEKKLDQLERVEDVELLVAVDESLGAGEAIESRDHRVIPYSGSVRVKDVRDALRTYERELVAAHAASLPDELVPDADAVSLATLAADYGVSEDAVEELTFPEHERVGRTLVRPRTLAELRGLIEDGQSLAEVEEVLDRHDLEETDAVLSVLGYRVEWDGLAGGTIREKRKNTS